MLIFFNSNKWDAEIAREDSQEARTSVIRVLAVWCSGTVEQEALTCAGACSAAAAMLVVPPRSVPSPSRLVPALELLAAMCFKNPNVAQVALNTR